MALQHLATILCEYIAARPDGRHTLVEMYQNIVVRELPAVKVPFCFMVELTSDCPTPFRITLEGPPGARTVEEGIIQAPPGVEEDQQWSTTLAAVAQPMVFPEQGVYSIVVWSGDEEIHRRKFGVFLKPEAEEPGLNTTPEA